MWFALIWLSWLARCILPWYDFHGWLGEFCGWLGVICPDVTFVHIQLLWLIVCVLPRYNFHGWLGVFCPHMTSVVDWMCFAQIWLSWLTGCVSPWWLLWLTGCWVSSNRSKHSYAMMWYLIFLLMHIYSAWLPFTRWANIWLPIFNFHPRLLVTFKHNHHRSPQRINLTSSSWYRFQKCQCS